MAPDERIGYKPMTLGFAKQPLTRYVARGMRAATKGREFDGHKFRYEDLKELWISADEHHVVLTHDVDPVWQYWCDTLDGGGWVLASIHHSLAAAQSAACDHQFAETQPKPGTYVVACAPGGEHRWIRVRVTSKDGPAMLRRIFTDLDYAVWMEEVGELMSIARTG